MSRDKTPRGYGGEEDIIKSHECTSGARRHNNLAAGTFFIWFSKSLLIRLPFMLSTNDKLKFMAVTC